jgi:hypothetical protein
LFRPPNQLSLIIYSDLLLTSRFKVSPAKKEKMTHTYMHVHIELFRPRDGVTDADMQMPACNFYTSVPLHMPGDILFIEIYSFRLYKNSL